MEKEIINVTDITEYLYCPRKVYLKRVKKIKTPPNKPMILGFLKHKVFDVFNKNEHMIVSGIKEDIEQEDILLIYRINLKSIIKQISENYSKMIYTFKINSEELSKQTLNFLEKEFSIRAESIKKTLNLGFLGKELWRNLQPKYLTEFQIISEQLGLKGRVDRIKIAEEILPYEIKTREDIYESDKLQLAAYSLLLEQEFGKEIKKGVIETSKKQQEIEITKEIKDKVLEIAEKIRNMKEEPEFPTNFNKCKNCFLRKECLEV